MSGTTAAQEKAVGSTFAVMTGNHAVSHGAMLARAQVIAAYPITPQTTIIELLSEMAADGRLDAQFLTVESEHSAMAACITASLAGARTYTATSSQGLALMHEMLHFAAGARTPVVMAEVSRALAPPWSIWNDQNDVMSQRDTGWLILFGESNQEALDLTLLAYRIAEEVKLPAMVVLDAFILSHTSEPVEVYAQELVDGWLPPFKPDTVVRAGDPRAFGGMARPDSYTEFRYKIQQSHERALELIREYGAGFGETFGRSYGPVETFNLEGAERVLVTTGATSSTAKFAVARMRERGEKVGLLKLVSLRPFPFREIRELLVNRNAVGVMDRNISFGCGGVTYNEIRSAMCGVQGASPLTGYVMGLGGRDITDGDIEELFDDMNKRTGGEEIVWKGVKGL